MIWGTAAYFSYIVGLTPTFSLNNQKLTSKSTSSTRSQERVFFDNANDSRRILENLKKDIEASRPKISRPNSIEKLSVNVPAILSRNNASSLPKIKTVPLARLEATPQPLEKLDPQIARAQQQWQARPVNDIELQRNWRISLLNSWHLVSRTGEAVLLSRDERLGEMLFEMNKNFSRLNQKVPIVDKFVGQTLSQRVEFIRPVEFSAVSPLNGRFRQHDFARQIEWQRKLARENQKYLTQFMKDMLELKQRYRP